MRQIHSRKAESEDVMKKFEIGKIYTVGSICNSQCVWRFTVISRTAQTITFTDGEEIRKCKINKMLSEHRGSETVLPFGKYSMCPILSA